MKKIGVLMVEGRHGVLGDLVRDVLEHAAGIELVGNVTDIDETSDAVGRTGCEAVVWMIPEGAAAKAPPALLDRHPALRILAVEGRGKHGSLWRMHPHRRRLDTLSPAGIVAELLRES